MKILSLGANSTKFCIHNLWASRELEIQKLTTQNGGGGQGGARGGVDWGEGCIVGCSVGAGVKEEGQGLLGS